jgi:hypothetical protein
MSVDRAFKRVVAKAQAFGVADQRPVAGRIFDEQRSRSGEGVNEQPAVVYYESSPPTVSVLRLSGVRSNPTTTVHATRVSLVGDMITASATELSVPSARIDGTTAGYMGFYNAIGWGGLALSGHPASMMLNSIEADLGGFLPNAPAGR